MRCPLCGGPGTPVNTQEGVGQCAGCGVRFRNPRPSRGAWRDARERQFAGALTRFPPDALRQARAAAVAAMRGYHRGVAGKDAPLNAFGKRVLDVGCGLGFRLRECEKYGWTVTGLEPSASAAATARALALPVVQADWEALPPGPFELILLEGVLEAVPEPAQVLAGVPAALAPTGVVAVAVTAGADDAPLEAGHLYRFGEEGARRLCMEAGFPEPDVREEAGALRLWCART